MRERGTKPYSACKVLLLLSCLTLALSSTANAQATADDTALRRLPEAFSAAFNKHDGHQLAAMMSEDVDFVTVGLTWFQGRSDFEKYHTRLLLGRFKDISYKILQTHVRVLRPDVAVVRHSWSIQGDKNIDGSARPPRFGMMTMIAEKRQGNWVVSQVQNTNGPTDTGPAIPPEAEGIASPPIIVPRPK